MGDSSSGDVTEMTERSDGSERTERKAGPEDDDKELVIFRRNHDQRGCHSISVR